MKNKILRSQLYRAKHSTNQFEYTEQNGEIIITKYTGFDTKINIPKKINGKIVTAIGSCAFEDRRSLTNIIIPSTVITIGSYAFHGTQWLENKQKEDPVVIINSILIDGRKCTGSLNIPDSVTRIGDYSFTD